MAVLGSGSKTLALMLQFVASVLVVTAMSKIGPNATPLRFSVKRTVRRRGSILLVGCMDDDDDDESGATYIRVVEECRQ